jgi:hypothetical protein
MQTALPSIWNYGNYSSENYGAHCMAVKVLGITVYYSYSTPIAFVAPGTNLIVRENNWGPTTGKHLNCIDGGDKRHRVSSEEFEKLWEQYVTQGLEIPERPAA